MKTADYDFHLPRELIALRPLERRDHARLLALHRDGSLEHKRFYDLPELLRPGDLLILNNSKVFPARLTGCKPTGGRLEILLVNEIRPGFWNILSRENYTGPLTLSETLHVHINSGKTVRFKSNTDIKRQLWKIGDMPLPPYIKRLPDETDKIRYQTVYAEVEGSIAAPTAGLHFTEELISRLREKSILVRFITLHVGIGTFKPVKTENVHDHEMADEFFEIATDLIEEIRTVKKAGNRVIAVGTTTTRALEGYFSGRCRSIPVNGTVTGNTDIFIYEGYSFCAIDSLITNFHLPRSTPLLLTAALSGNKYLLGAYRKAVDMGYRFFSYGDAMILI